MSNISKKQKRMMKLISFVNESLEDAVCDDSMPDALTSIINDTIPNFSINFFDKKFVLYVTSSYASSPRLMGEVPMKASEVKIAIASVINEFRAVHVRSWLRSNARLNSQTISPARERMLRVMTDLEAASCAILQRISYEG